MPIESQLLAEFYNRSGLKKLSRAWAKLEIVLGLIAAGLGLFAGNWAVGNIEQRWFFLAAGLLLFVLGWYLALAGHRSHLYQSANESAAFLIEEIRRLIQKDH